MLYGLMLNTRKWKSRHIISRDDVMFLYEELYKLPLHKPETLCWCNSKTTEFSTAYQHIMCCHDDQHQSTPFNQSTLWRQIGKLLKCWAKINLQKNIHHQPRSSELVNQSSWVQMGYISRESAASMKAYNLVGGSDFWAVVEVVVLHLIQNMGVSLLKSWQF